MFGFLKKFFGTAHDRLVKKYAKLVPLINEWEVKYQPLTDEELAQKTIEFKERIANGESVDLLLPEAYAVVKNACRRLCGSEVDVSGYRQKWDMIPYDVQLIGAIAMHYGAISEMQTGEGKTLTASLPLYLNALTGKPVHLVTVNDYLAKRDCSWMGSIFQKLQIRVAYLTNDVHSHERKNVYEADIVYGTASEFGFDYLRDNSIATSKEEQCQRKPFYFGIVDEIDSILIDEARTPLIISGPSASNRQMYDTLKDGVAQLVRMQRDICNLYASDARKFIESIGHFNEGPKKKLSKEEQEKEDIAFKKLWLVNKGTPQNKVLKRVKEDPDLRALLDTWETYYFSEQNKEEKAEALSNLYIIVDERANEYELTDKGIHAWAEIHNQPIGSSDFIMYDLGDEYAKIDSDTALSELDKMERKIKICEADALRKERAHNLRQLFRAHLLMEKDVDYIVQENKIIIIDENTGRPQPGRRFSDGLHQALEAKESVTIQQETQTYATITLQNYFRMYEKLAGMTGTAITEANEFKEIYKLDVLEIPTYCHCKRMDYDDEIYMTEREKYAAILEEIRKTHEKGRPILIGTESVEVSEKLSRILKQAKLPHAILNAKHHEKEAEIISDAGKKGAITLATNMAGRGTDIKLSKEVAQSGGLYVMGTTRHHSRRIDRQLRGRSGRLGDPGSSKFFVSFEDSLLRLFTSPRLTAMLQRFRPPEGEPISAKIMNRS
ncbi:MAG: DEAD/DEAH box helicase, partial [Chlamydiota bacterium]